MPSMPSVYSTINPRVLSCWMETSLAHSRLLTVVLQGNVLTPCPFNVLNDNLMTKATEDTDSGVVTQPGQSRRQTIVPHKNSLQ